MPCVALGAVHENSTITKDAVHGGRGSWHTVHRIDKWAPPFKLIIVNDGLYTGVGGRRCCLDVGYACSVQRCGTGWTTNAEAQLSSKNIDFVRLGTYKFQ